MRSAIRVTCSGARLVLASVAAIGCGNPSSDDSDADSPSDIVEVEDGATDSSDVGDDGEPLDAPSEGEPTDVSPDADGGDEASGDVPGSPYCPVVGFVPCGGDLLGRWALRAMCPEDPAAAAALYESPYDDHPECVGGGNEINGRSQVEGTFEFTSDGQVTHSTTSTTYIDWVFTDACLVAAGLVGAAPDDRCAAVANPRLACDYAPDACRCVADPMEQADGGGTTYVVSGNQVTLGEEPPAEYCVEGDSLIMDYSVYHPVSWRHWVFERLP